MLLLLPLTSPLFLLLVLLMLESPLFLRPLLLLLPLLVLLVLLALLTHSVHVRGCLVGHRCSNGHAGTACKAYAVLRGPAL